MRGGERMALGVNKSLCHINLYTDIRIYSARGFDSILGELYLIWLRTMMPDPLDGEHYLVHYSHHSSNLLDNTIMLWCDNTYSNFIVKEWINETLVCWSL